MIAAIAGIALPLLFVPGSSGAKPAQAQVEAPMPFQNSIVVLSGDQRAKRWLTNYMTAPPPFGLWMSSTRHEPKQPRAPSRRATVHKWW